MLSSYTSAGRRYGSIDSSEIDQLGPDASSLSTPSELGATIYTWLPQGVMGGLAMACLLNWYPMAQGVRTVHDLLAGEADTTQATHSSCITSSEWSGKLILHKGTEIRSEHTIDQPGSDLLGTALERKVYAGRFCYEGPQDGTGWFGIDAPEVGDLEGIATATDSDDVAWVHGTSTTLVQKTPLTPQS